MSETARSTKLPSDADLPGCRRKTFVNALRDSTAKEARVFETLLALIAFH